MKRKVFIYVICAVLIILWVYAALSKLADYHSFTIQLKIQPLPYWLISVLKPGLPLVELITAGLLYFQKTRAAGLYMSFGLLLSFTLYVIFALRGTFGEIPCSCAGIISAFHWKGHLIFNLIFTFLNVEAICLRKGGNQIVIDYKSGVI